MALVGRLLRERTETVVLVALVVLVLGASSLLSDDPTPLGIHAVGLIAGAGLALPAIGIVLVYRTNRVINFAQLQMGAIAGTLFLRLVEQRTLLRGLARICPPCLPEPATLGDVIRRAGGPGAEQLTGNSELGRLASLPLSDPAVVELLPRGLTRQDFSVGSAPGWLVQANYWLALLLAVALATLLVWLVYILVVKRFNSAPRLILTVITLCAGELATTVGFFALDRAIPQNSGEVTFAEGAPIPVKLDLRLDPAVLHTADLLVLLVALGAGAGLYAFFRYSRAGIVLRGAAENPQRAETLGVNLTAVTARAWIIAGSLSGIAAVLGVAQSGLDSFDGNDTLVRVLAAAVVGGLVSLPLTIAGALGVGLIDQSIQWATGSPALVAALLVGAIVALLLAQRARASRADVESQASWLASRELRPIPRELRNLGPVRTTLRLGMGMAFVVVVGLPWVLSPGQVSAAVVNMLYLLILLSLLILTGWAGQISLAQMSLAAVGGYVAAVSHLPFFLALPVGAMAGAAVAALLGFPALRLRGQYLAISSLAFALAVSQILIGPRYLGSHLPSELRRPILLGIDFEDDRSYYYLTLVFVVLTVLAVVGLRRSPVARTLIACKDNEQAAQAFGLNLVRARLAAFALSGCIAAFSGGLLAYAQHGVIPGSYSAARSVDMFLFAIIGGFGSIAGPICGIAYLLIVQLISSAVPILGLLSSPSLGVIVLLFVAPGGVSGLLCGLRDSWLRRLADRHRIEVPSLSADRKTGDAGLIPIEPKLRPGGGGGAVPVPTRFRLPDQWVVDAQKRETVDG